MADAATPISPVTGSRPELTISAPPINDEPVELDSTPASPERTRNGRRGSKGDNLADLSPEEREKRKQRISERKGDPAVLVDIPQTPGAEEFGKSKNAEATVSNKAAGSEQKASA